MFLDTAGNIYTCGSNDCGQLGLGDTADSETHHRKSTISLQCLVFLLATQRWDICKLWMKKEEHGMETQKCGKDIVVDERMGNCLE